MRVKRILKRAYRHTRQVVLREGRVNARGTGLVNLIDVGAAGTLPAPWYRHAACIKSLLAFEPRQAQHNPAALVCDVALWSRHQQRPMYIYRGLDGHGSSLLPQNYAYVREHFAMRRQRGPRKLANTWFQRSQLVGIEHVECRTLDDVLAQLAPPEPYHFLKIDAQGAEHEILQGASQFLKQHCLGLHLELFVFPLYRGVVLLPDMVDYLDQQGFELVKTFPPHGSFDSQHDCLFLKRGQHGAVIDTIQSIYSLI
jgi:FkbM family methyltransferase